MSFLKRSALGAGLMAVVAMAAATSQGPTVGKAGTRVGVTAPAGAGVYLVVFDEPALGSYRGGIAGIAAPQRRAGARGKVKLDVHGAAARNYVAYLENVQLERESRIGKSLGRGLVVRSRMQHALNGIVTELSAAEARTVARMPGVRLVEAYREYRMDTDVGPALIGAPAVWDGSNPGAPAAYQGEGIVFGILDSGINFGSPSFAAQSPGDGYVHVNPLGAGVHLGTCEAGEVDEGRCNTKLIGGYDFVCNAPANQCGVANIREEPGFGDTNGHGSHTASTAAGNRRTVAVLGNPRAISGVAPRGNIVAFDICYTNIATGQGLCPNVSAVSAVDQSIADGLVDVINYSIGGGGQPWSEAVSLAFLNAVDAGVYVAASAGNSGPNPNTMGHLEPWVSSTAAAQHGRGAFSIVMSVTGPPPIPEPLTAVILNEGAGGVAHSAAISALLRVSPGFDSADDGCVAFAPGTFAGAIAVMRRGTCSFTIKTDSASAAGAIAVVIANNAAGALIPSVPDTTVPVFGASQADGVALRDFAIANPAATATIGFPGLATPNTPDALAAFSSRGPAGTFDLLKPDMTAPGVSVLAAVSGTTLTGSEQAVALYNGTSMASPHQAGSVGLIRQARPGWTMPEIKSALAMTAKQQVLLEDEVTPANPFARGSGRIRVDAAINAGLLLDETADAYLAANPAAGGDPTTLNQPNFANGRCLQSCVFFRTFRNPTTRAQTWVPRITGVSGTVAPKVIKVAAGATVTVKVTIDSRTLPATGAWNFGTLTLAASGVRDRNPPAPLHLPIAIAVPAPAP